MPPVMVPTPANLSHMQVEHSEDSCNKCTQCCYSSRGSTSRPAAPGCSCSRTTSATWWENQQLEKVL